MRQNSVACHNTEDRAVTKKKNWGRRTSTQSLCTHPLIAKCTSHSPLQTLVHSRYAESLILAWVKLLKSDMGFNWLYTYLTSYNISVWDGTIKGKGNGRSMREYKKVENMICNDAVMHLKNSKTVAKSPLLCCTPPIPKTKTLCKYCNHLQTNCVYWQYIYSMQCPMF